MGKIRVNKKEKFTVISNNVLENERLSLKAKGLFAVMWSKPDTWEYSVAGLEKQLKEGKDAINAALKELEAEGYLVRTILRKGGKFSEMDYILNEYPVFQPFTENPQAVNPITENPQQVNTKEVNKDKSKDPLPTVKGEQAPSTKKSYNEVFNAPENESIKDALVKYVNVCKGRNIRFQYRTLERWAKTLRENAGDNPTVAMAMVDQSIDRGWKDIYPLKKGYSVAKKEAVSIPVTEADKAKNPDGSYVVF